MDIQKLDCWYSLLRALPAVASLIVVSQFLGGTLLKRAHLSVGITPANHFHFAGVIGFNLLGLVAIVVGNLPWSIRSASELALVLMALLWLSRRIGDLVIYLHASIMACTWRQLIFILPIVFTLGPALTYPSGWDELVYHLELPRRWHEAQALNVQLDLPYSALPSMLEAILTLTYPLESLITPRLLVWVIWLHGLCMFRYACGRVCSHTNANCLTLAMVACPASLLISANCYVESLIWANTAGLLWVIVCSTRQLSHPITYPALLGLFIGGAIAIKMTSVGLLCLPIFLAFIANDRAKLSALQAALVLLMAIGWASPFYLRTWCLVGNPVAPFYAQWFTNDVAWLVCSHYHHDLAVSNFGMRGLPGFLVGPSALAFAYELYDGSFGWQWLLLLLLLVVAVMRASMLDGPRRNFVRVCIASACMFYGLWFLTSQQARFAIPLAMIVIFCAGIGIETYREPAQRGWRVALVGLSLVSIPWINFGYYLDSWFCVMKVRTPLDYVRDGVTDSYAELSLYLHEQLPKEAKCVTLFEHRLTYLPPQVEIATPYFQVKYFRSPSVQTPENLMAELREAHISHVILTTNPLGPDVSSNRIEDQRQWFRNIDECLASGRLKVIWKSEFHAVAEVSEAGRGHRSKNL